MISVTRIVAVSSKEWREIVRDRLFFSLAFIVPIMLMLLFGYGLSMDVEHIPFAIVDQDGSSMSRDYAYCFMSSRYFDFAGYLRNEREIGPLLTDNKIRAVIVIPEHFQKNLLTSHPAHVQTIIDGTFPFRSQITKAYVTAINNAFSMELLVRHLSSVRGVPDSEAEQLMEPVKLEIRYLYNQSVKSIWSIAPNLLMVVLIMTTPFLTALGVVREKESGAIYNIYSSTVSRLEFLVGKLAPYMAISTMNAIVLWLLATTLFRAPFKGNIVFFFIVSLLYVICTTGIGLVVSVFVRTQIAAMIVTTILTVLPSVLYSGLLIPVESLTKGSRIVAHMLPSMYYSNIVAGSFLKGIGPRVLWVDVVALAAYAIILFLAGYCLFTKRPSI